MHYYTLFFLISFLSFLNDQIVTFDILYMSDNLEKNY